MSESKQVFETDVAETEIYLKRLSHLVDQTIQAVPFTAWNTDLCPAISRAAIAALLVHCALEVCALKGALDDHEQKVFLQFINGYIKSSFQIGAVDLEEGKSMLAVGFRDSRTIAQESEQEGSY
jgi:hypothetical protein